MTPARPGADRCLRPARQRAPTPVGEGDAHHHHRRRQLHVTITAANDNLDGLAKAINDANAGVTASVVTDANGARLVVKGETGEAKAFTLSVPGGTTSGLERFASAAMTDAAQEAQDAIVRLDGVEVTRAANSFSDLIPGVQIDLKSAKPGTPRLDRRHPPDRGDQPGRPGFRHRL